MNKPIVGGGPKKLLYTLKTASRIGVLNSAKALKSNNTCKACGLGMGGQQGGMTNELGEFPAVCNKSVQAQSTDIQPAIPEAVFEHSIEEMKQLSAHELEHAGRLGFPIYKALGATHFQPVDWDWAFEYAAARFKWTDPGKTFFYSSGRSSNESGFLLQLLARLYGTNNVNNCSYYCHQATSVGLSSTIGTGTATVELEDLTQCDTIFVIGANPSSNHPRFIHKLKDCRERGGNVVVINPAKEPGLVKFAVPKSARSMIVGGTEIASHYLQPNIGGDIALFKGIAKAVLAEHREDVIYIQKYCDGYEQFKADIESTTWDSIESASGVARASIEEVAKVYCRSENTVFAWGMGMTHHQFGGENVEYIANLALLRGMVGKRFAGLLPLRGHSNVQGIGTIGVKPVLPEAVFEKLEKTLNIKLPQEPGMDTYHCIKAAEEEAIEAACLVGGNLYSATPDSNWAARALNKISFKLYLTTTLNQGHLHGIDDGAALILPVTARDEEPQPTTQESMFNFVRLSDGGIERLENVRSEVFILSELGKRLVPKAEFDFSQFGDHERIRETIAKTIPGMSKLKDIAVAKEEFHINGRIMHEPVFNTDNSRAQFVVHGIPQVASETEEFPYLLATIRSEGQFNTIIYEETDSYRYDASRRSILIGKADMKRLDVNTGDKVKVVSAAGVMEDAIVQWFDLTPGNVLAYFPEANVLTEQKLDPRSKTPNFKSIPVAIIKK